MYHSLLTLIQSSSFMKVLMTPVTVFNVQYQLCALYFLSISFLLTLIKVEYGWDYSSGHCVCGFLRICCLCLLFHFRALLVSQFSELCVSQRFTYDATRLPRAITQKIAILTYNTCSRAHSADRLVTVMRYSPPDMSCSLKS